MNEQNNFKKIIHNALIWLKKLVSHNWPFKLLAVVIAIVLWSALIANDDSLVREKVFTGVDITVSGQETAKRNGFIVTSNLNDLPKVIMSVDVPQKMYEKANASTFSLRVDLSKIREAGTQEIKLSTSNSATYGSVTSVNPQAVTVEVDQYVTRYRIPVTAIISGEVGGGYYATQPSMDPPSVRISGPKSLVNQISRVEVNVDQSQLPKAEGTYQTAYPFRLVSFTGEEIDQRLMEVTSESVLIDSIVAEQTVYEKKELSLEEIGLVTGEPAHGYEIKSISIVPEIITVAGKHDALALLDHVFTDSKIDISGKTESVQTNLTIRKPAELNYLSTNMVSVTVEIGESASEKKFGDVRIAVENLPSNLSASTSVKYGDVFVTGTTLRVEKLKTSAVSAFVDVEGLEIGEYDLPVQVRVETDDRWQFTMAAAPETIHVVIKERK